MRVLVLPTPFRCCLTSQQKHMMSTGVRLSSTVVSSPSALVRQLAKRRLHPQRGFQTSARRAQQVHGVIYNENGDPRELIRAHSWSLPKPSPTQVIVRVGLASINPADVNVIQGVYPAKPKKVQLDNVDEPVFVGGNEGYGIVEQVAEQAPAGGKENELKKGDWVVFGQPQMGTWKSHVVCESTDVIKVVRGTQSSSNKLTPVMASTLQVNPPTAFRMLNDFVTLNPQSDAVIQNTANSAVGQLVAQMAARKLGVPSINLVRDRPDLSQLRQMFGQYGAVDHDAKAHLFTYEGLRDRDSGVKEEIKKLLGGRTVRLGLNALCGPDNANMCKLLAPNAALVTYGAMSKQPLSLPAGLVIFQNVSVHGFMMNKWYAQHSRAERRRLMQELVEWYEQGIIEPPAHEVVTLSLADDEQERTRKAREALSKSMGGGSGKKIFFDFQT